MGMEIPMAMWETDGRFSKPYSAAYGARSPYSGNYGVSNVNVPGGGGVNIPPPPTPAEVGVIASGLMSSIADMIAAIAIAEASASTQGGVSPQLQALMDQYAAYAAAGSGGNLGPGAQAELDALRMELEKYRRQSDPWYKKPAAVAAGVVVGLLGLFAVVTKVLRS